MKRLTTIMLLGLGAIFALSAQDVAYNFDQNADFSKYKTYRWVKHPQSLDIDQITLNQLKTSTEAELAKKGLTVSNTDQSDLVIVYQLATQNEKEITSWDTGYGYGPGWRGGWYGGGGMGMSTSTTNTITIGAVVLDMYDASTKNLIWRGKASKTLDPKAKPDKRQKNIQKAVAKLLKNYPPKKK